MSFEIDVKIEVDALDIECLQQPRLLLKYATVVASAEKQLSVSKRELDLVKAELDKAIRSEPDLYEVTKVTETAIFSTILQQDIYREAEDVVIQAQYDLRIAKGALEAMQQKKDMLEALIRLHGQQYFAGPKVPRDLGYEWRQKETQSHVDQVVATKLKRNK